MNAKIAYILADQIRHIAAGQFPDETRRLIRQHLLDAMAAALIGFQTPLAQSMSRKANLQRNGVPWPGGGADRLSALDGGMIWAFAINSSVYEDGSREGACHPAAAVVPALFAFGGSATWDRVDRALLAGYEVMVRVARSGNPGFIARGFHPTSVTAPFAAAAVASILLELDAKATVQALCMAALGASGLMKAFRQGTSQPLQVAWSVRNGLQSALLAHAGHHGHEDIFEDGFYPAYLGHPPEPALDLPLRYPTALEGSYLKPTPGCRHLQPAIDAFKAAVHDQKVEPEQIDHLKVETYTTAVETEITTLASRGDAYFNIPYALAAQLILGRTDWDAFDERHFNNPHILAVLDRTEVHVDSDIQALYPEKRGAKVTLALVDGSVLDGYADLPLGEPENPIPERMTLDKLTSAAAAALLSSPCVDKLAQTLETRYLDEPFGELIAQVSGE